MSGESSEGMKAILSVVIVNWNAGSQLKACIDSLVSPVVREIFVVDNASTDGSEVGVGNRSGVTLIRASENLGFGKACNLGAMAAVGEFVLFLNPDAFVYSDTLEKALAFMKDQRNAEVGICGVQLVDESGHVARSCARFPTPVGFLLHSVGVDRIFPRLGHFMNDWLHDSTRDVDHVIGAFFLIRNNLFRRLDGFDERFFVYLEDLDFSLRAHQLGWRSIYLSNVMAFHAGGGTSRRVKAKRLFYSLRSRLLYAAKHFSLGGAALVFLGTLFVEPISRTTLAIAKGSWSSLKETWQGYALLWRWLPRWLTRGVTR